MRYLVTGSAGHLGEALIRVLRSRGHEVTGLDVNPSQYTDVELSITDREAISECMRGIDGVFHAATLHKPHVATHTLQDFIDTNVTGTLNLLEAAVAANVESFVFTSTTSVYGNALRPADAEPAVWVTEELAPSPRNIYGVTKLAAEGVCELIHKRHGLPCVVLRTSRFFPEEDDNAEVRQVYSNDNLKVNEYPYRRADIADMVSAHLCAMGRSHEIGFDKFIVSATTPFLNEDVAALRHDAPGVLEARVPGCAEVFDRLDWQMFPGIGRVYVNAKARQALGWLPEHNFGDVIDRLRREEDYRSALAVDIGAKGYHEEDLDSEDRPYPVSD